MRKHLRLNFSDTNLVKTQRETTQFDVKMTVISYWSKRKLICSFVRNLHTKQHISSINCFFIFYSGFSQVSVETSQQGMFTCTNWPRMPPLTCIWSYLSGNSILLQKLCFTIFTLSANTMIYLLTLSLKAVQRASAIFFIFIIRMIYDRQTSI